MPSEGFEIIKWVENQTLDRIAIGIRIQFSFFD